MDFKHVELPDLHKKDAPLLSHLNVKVSGGQILAIVPLDNGKLNPFEFLIARLYDPVRGRLVRRYKYLLLKITKTFSSRQINVYSLNLIAFRLVETTNYFPSS